VNDTPYTMRWTDCYANIHIHNVYCPAVVSDFFGQSNKIDYHNQVRQSLPGLVKCWVTQDCWFRLDTTPTFIRATDEFRLCMYHALIHASTTISEFARKLTRQLIDMGKLIDFPIPPRSLQTKLRFNERDTSSPRVLHLATPSPIETQQNIFSLIDQNGEEHLCMPYHKDVYKKGKIKQKGFSVLCAKI
jgi:hypothetical protein